MDNSEKSPTALSHEEKDSVSLKGTAIEVGDPDAQWGGKEARQRLERKLLLKLDLRMGILVVIYVCLHSFPYGQ
jgi:zinc transporter ZupT